MLPSLEAPRQYCVVRREIRAEKECGVLPEMAPYIVNTGESRPDVIKKWKYVLYPDIILKFSNIGYMRV
jgi:hypothetical protein